MPPCANANRGAAQAAGSDPRSAPLWKGAQPAARLCEEFSRLFGVPHVFLLSSGKVALTIALEALGTLSERCEVIIPALAYQHLSVSKTYPSALNGIRELMPCAVRNESAYPGAETVAQQILTLPTHPFVLQSDLGRVAALIRALR